MHCPLSTKLHCKNLQSVVAAHAMGEMGDDTSSDVFESAAADKDNDIYTSQRGGVGEGEGAGGRELCLRCFFCCFALRCLL